MPIQTVTQRNSLADRYAALATHAGLSSAVPGATAPTELTGGSPAYARRALSWSAAANSATSASATFDVGSGSTVRGVTLHTALTAGTYLDGASVPEQPFSSQGTYQVALTYTQS